RLEPRRSGRAAASAGAIGWAYHSGCTFFAIRRAAGRRLEQQPAGELPEDDPDGGKEAEPDQPQPQPAEEVRAPQQGDCRAGPAADHAGDSDRPVAPAART